ncbi:MAG: hypothetical protein JWN93_1828 [Hyphomicrobiales bacterium]|nr:hypothetical protein [Hyphomicrobiales bacterium]
MQKSARTSLLPTALLALLALCAVPGASHAADFYAGKRITLLINFAPGGPTDIEGRLLARHLGKHIPGKPSILPQNMEGAGGGVGTNYLGEIAPRDGTTMGYLTGAAWRYVSVKEKSRVDFMSYTMVAYQPGTTVYYVRADTAPGLKGPGDVLKAQGLVIGGLSADSSKDLLLRLTSDMLGLKYKYVTGYKSNSGARLAFQRGEITYFAESPPGYRSIVEPGMVAKGEAIPLFYDPGWNGTRFAEPSQIKGVPLPPFHEFYKQVKGVEPSGRLWDVYRQALALNGAMQRMVVFPPDVPAAAVQDIRAALRKLDGDREYAQDAEKLLGFVPDYEASDGVQAEVRKALAISDEDRAWLEDYVKSAPN